MRDIVTDMAAETGRVRPYLLLLLLAPLAALPGCKSKMQTLYEREARQATVRVVLGRSVRSPEEVVSCLKDNPTRRLNVRDLGFVHPAMRVVVNQSRHMLVTLRAEGRGTRVAVYLRPHRTLSVVHEKALQACLSPGGIVS